LRAIANEILGYAPKENEVLPDDKYQRIYSAFHSFVLPGMIVGRVDSAVFAQSAPQYSLQRIVQGMETCAQNVLNK